MIIISHFDCLLVRSENDLSAELDVGRSRMTGIMEYRPPPDRWPYLCLSRLFRNHRYSSNADTPSFGRHTDRLDQGTGEPRLV